jgi:crossover junction endodeoxyribonuclease RuvC
VIVLGIDPGLTGALAVVSREGSDGRVRLVSVIDVPIIGEDAKREVSPTVLTFIQNNAPNAAYIERANWRPGQQAMAGFLYGGIYLSLRLAVRGCLVPLTSIESRAWKRAHDMPSRTEDEQRQAKEDSRQRALHLFPEASESFGRVMDHNRAEASLIAYYGMMLSGARHVAAPAA